MGSVIAPPLPIETPFGEPVPSVHLGRAPLELVVAQVRFPQVLGFDQPINMARIAEFQDGVKGDYPFVQPERQLAISFGPTNVSASPEGVTTYRFTNTDHPWEVTLSPNFMALQTKGYTDRADFLGRFQVLIEVLQRTFGLTKCERLGVRYSSRIAEPELFSRLVELVRPEISAVPLAALTQEHDPLSVQRVHAVTDTLYSVSDMALRARWGVIPAGTTIDLSLLPAPTESFLIDIDVFSAGPMDLDVEGILAGLRRFSDAQYRYFRWMVTMEYLRAFGAEL